MDGVGTGRGLWRNLKQRWRLNGIGCCGSEWTLGAANLSFREQQQDPPSIRESISAADGSQITPRTSSDLPCLGQILAATATATAANASSAVNLATALAAERIPRTTLRAAMEAPSMTPLRSLMGWIEDADNGGEEARRKREEGGGGGDDRVCCVCMERNKGAAFIPCGHTYCRICSRELWLDRGACPLCNRPITEVLDIF